MIMNTSDDSSSLRHRRVYTGAAADSDAHEREPGPERFAGVV